MTPEAVAAELFKSIEEMRWDDIPALIDPLALEENALDVLHRARAVVLGAQTPLTVDDYLRGNPELPRAVAEYWVAQRNKQGEPNLITEFGAASVEELEQLSPAQIFSNMMRLHDDRMSAANVLALSRPDAIDNFEPPPVKHDVLGSVISEDHAFVVYRDRFESQLLVLRDTIQGWRIMPTGPLFRGASRLFGFIDPPLSATPVVEQTRWTDRRFDHQLEVGLFPSVLERFRGTPARLRELIGSELQSVRVARPDGKWSLQEHAGHLLDLEELGEQRLADFSARRTELSAADMSNQKTQQANHNQAKLWELLDAFEKARGKLVDALAALPAEVIAHKAMHPRLKRTMNVPEWVFFMCEHDDHHLAIMRRQAAMLAQSRRVDRSQQRA